MKALIDPTRQTYFISSWSNTKPYKPVYAIQPDSAMVCQIEEQEFAVAEPLFWVNCSAEINSADYYFNTVTQTCDLIVNTPMPDTTQGLQTV